MTQLKAREATRRRLNQAVAASLLLHLGAIGAASRFPSPPAPRDEVFTVTLDIPKAQRPPIRLPAHEKPRVARPNPPRRPTSRPRHANPFSRPLQNAKQRFERLNRPVPNSEAPLVNAPRSDNVRRPAPSRGRDSSAEQATLPQDSVPPRSGRPARGRKSDAMQLTLNSGSDFHLDSGDHGPSGPTMPGGAGSSDARRGSETGSDDSNLVTESHSGRVMATIPDGGGARHAINDAPDSADANDHSPDQSVPRGTSRHSGRRRDDSEHESAAPLPIPPASGFPAPEPTATPKPAPKPVELREKPESKVPDVFRRARIRSQSQPDYPASAREANQEGDTTLRLSISADGDVINADVVGSSGSSALDEAAARGARRWRYDPARQGDAPVASSVKAVVHWRLIVESHHKLNGRR